MANPYRRLLALLPTTPRQVGEVISVSGSRVRVDLVGGGARTCQGDAQVDGMVYGSFKKTGISLKLIPVFLNGASDKQSFMCRFVSKFLALPDGGERYVLTHDGAQCEHEAVRYRQLFW